MRIDRHMRARMLAGLVALMGVLDVASSAYFAVTGRLQWLRNVLPPAITSGSRGINLAAGFLLLAIAWNLAQRKEAAWYLASWLLLISAASHVLKGLDLEEAAIALLLLAVMWVYRHDFTVRSDPGSIQSLLFGLPYVIAFYSLYCVLGFYLLRHQLQPAFDIGAAINDAIRLATFQGEQFYRPLTVQARWFLESITLMAGIGLVYLTYSMMRPVLQVTPVTRRDRETAANIVRQFGHSGIAYFALGDDKSYFFDEDSTCVIPHVLVGGVALAAGDAIGPEQGLGPTIDAFCALCERNDWIPAFYQTQQTTLPLYTAVGLEALKIGEEALIDVQTFDTRGKAKDDLRSASNRASRLEWQFRAFEHCIQDAALADQLKEISEAWLADKFGGEMGFTMGGSPIAGSDETLVTVAAEKGGRVLAFMTWVPMYGVQGWAGDHMRRAKDAPNGVMEWLIVASIDHFRQRGDRLISLGLAPLANVEPSSSEAMLSLERGMELIYQRFNSAYHYKSLYAFKAKFVPRWESRFLVYPGLASLPRVVYALVNAQISRFSLADMSKLVRGPRRASAASGRSE